MTATLIIPYNGYTAIELIEKSQYQWLCKICGSGAEVLFYEDEFILD